MSGGWIKTICYAYGIDVKRGDRVLYTGGETPAQGVVTGAVNSYLRIRLDGEKRSRRYHPIWELTILPRAAISTRRSRGRRAGR